MKFASPRKAGISHWLHHHRDSLNKTTTRIVQRPVSFFSTVMLIAIAFAIPLALFTILHAIEDVTTYWEDDRQITLFLQQDIDLEGATQLARDLQQQFAIDDANAVDKHQVLADFSQQTQYTLMAKTWQHQNPLPHVIKVQPAEQANLEHLAGLFATHPDVDQVQFDWLWFQRLDAIAALIVRIQWIISSLLIITVVLIIVNVVRWEIADRTQEIEIIKLIGANDAFVQRPFLYFGAMLGFSGALLAIFMAQTSSLLINQALLKLSDLFGGDFALTGFSATSMLLLLAGGGLIGICAAAIAAQQKIHTII